MDKRSRQFYPLYFTLPALLIFGVFFALPILAGFVLSFTDWNISRLTEPVFNGVENFIFIFSDANFTLSIQNTLYFAVLTCLLIIVLGFVLAFILTHDVFGKNFFRTIFYMPAVLSLVVIGIIFTSVFRMDGLFNQMLSAIGLEGLQRDWLANPDISLNIIVIMQAWKWSGFSMAIFIAGMQGISKDYYEAATIDGCGFFQKLKSITLPLLTPAFTVVITMNVIGSLKVFEQVYVLTGGGPGFSTQVMGTYIYNAFSKGLLGRSTAMGLVLFIIVSFISIIINNILRRKEVEL